MLLYSSQLLKLHPVLNFMFSLSILPLTIIQKQIRDTKVSNLKSLLSVFLRIFLFYVLNFFIFFCLLKHIIIDNSIVNFTKFSLKKNYFRRSISKRILLFQKMVNVERWVSSWQWHVLSMGSANTCNTPDMGKQI